LPTLWAVAPAGFCLNHGVDAETAVRRWADTWSRAWPQRPGWVLRFDDEGRMVDHRDYDNYAERREAPYADW
jgi:hypothetical protein